MSTKSIFDIHVPLTRAALLRLIKGEHVEHRGSPPGATMIEGVAKVVLHPEVTDGERRAIGDALTRDVPQQYAGGYAIASWGDNAPVVGTTEWLTMIASNADRIPIKVQTGPNTWATIYLAEATLDQQKDAIRTWLSAGITPTWEKHAPPAAKTTGAADVASQGFDGFRVPMMPVPPAPKPPPFKAPTMTPTEEARNKIGLIRWIAEQSFKVGSEWHLTTREREFLTSVEQRLRMGELPTDKQAQWLDDIHSTAKRKASTISHLLPPIPKFT